MHNATFLYVVCQSEAQACTIGHVLLEKHLAACINRFPVASSYWWQGTIVQDQEFVLLIKTIETLYELAVKEIEQLHSYQVPCIAKINVHVNESFGQWLENECKS